ncbi:MAG: hypothetical protein R6V49_00980 [Bacteroidales bacterium]
MTLQDYQIDKRVKESFGEYQVSPPASVWNRLEQSIGNGKRARVALLRRRFLAVAAVILAFITGYLAAILYSPQQEILLPGEGQQQLASHQPRPELPDVVVTPVHPTEKAPDGNNGIPVPSGRNSLLQAYLEPQTGKLPPMQQLFTMLTVQDSPYDFTDDLVIPEAGYPYLITSLPPGQDAIPTFIDVPDNGNNAYGGRFAVAGLAGQTYANYYLTNLYQQYSYSTGQVYEFYQHDIVASSKELVNKPSVSYGVTMDFGITQRIGISTGIATHQFAAPLTYGSGEIALLSIQKPVYNQFGVVHFNENIRSEMAKNPLLAVNTGEFIQKFSYVEVPVTGVYTLIDRKVNLDIRAGVGGNVLTGNKVVLVTSEETTEMGTTDGMRRFYLSGVAGLDVSMQFGEHWRASFSPVYRHALQGVSHQESPKPHIISLGLYTGLRYRF